MKTLLIGNGECTINTLLLDQIAEADSIIAVDGGANHCYQFEILPTFLIGDFDSIDKKIFQFFLNKNVEIRQFPPEKDASDLELGLDLALDTGAQEIVLAGFLGGRWDMSLSTILLSAHPKYAKMRISIVHQDCVMHVLHPHHECTFSNQGGKTVSLLPLSGDAEKVTLSGFQYPLDNYTIPACSSIGVSNIIADDTASIRFTGGTLLCIIDS